MKVFLLISILAVWACSSVTSNNVTLIAYKSPNRNIAYATNAQVTLLQAMTLAEPSGMIADWIQLYNRIYSSRWSAVGGTNFSVNISLRATVWVSLLSRNGSTSTNYYIFN